MDFDIKNNVLLRYYGQEKNIVLPDEVRVVDRRAFAQRDIESVDLNKAETVDEYAFSKCRNLKKVNFGNVYNIEKHAFSFCEGLEEINISAKVIKSKVFYYCVNLNKVILPDSLKEIDSRAFMGCSSLCEIILKNNNNYVVIDNILYNKDMTELLSYPANKPNKEFAVPDSVKRINTTAFYLNQNLEKINLNNTEFLCLNAFAFSRNLKEVIGKKLKTIGECSFRFCEKLDTLDMPENAVAEPWCFEGCKSLTEIPTPNIENIVGNYSKCGIKEINLEKVKNIDSFAFICNPLEKVTLGGNIENIGMFSFYNCKKLKEVIIKGKLKSIGRDAFYYCEKLEKINLSEGLETIDFYAFKNCYSLKEIVLPETLNFIGENAFANTGLEEIKIPKGCKMVSDSAFWGCDNLKRIYISKETKTENYTFPANIEIIYYNN